MKGDEVATRQRLDSAVGLLRLHFGAATFNDYLSETELRLDDGGQTFRSESIRMVFPNNDGPFLDPINWKDTEEILEKIDLSEDKARLRLALEYLYRGTADSDFASFWIALELICDDHHDKTFYKKLSETYKLSFAEVKKGDAAGFKYFLRCRQQFFHKGLRPAWNADAERFFQLLLLDLLRNELGMERRTHAATYLKFADPNLNDLGLTDKVESFDPRETDKPTDKEVEQAIDERAKYYAEHVKEWGQKSKDLWN